MMDKIHQRLHNDEGFTLVELMVVVLIIAILMAIAIPTFLGARQKAQDRAAQSDLRNALTAAKVFYVDGETYGTVLADAAAAYALLEPSIAFDVIAAVDTDTVAVTTVSKDEIVMVTESGSGTFFCIADRTTGAGTTYGSGAAATDVDTTGAGECVDPSW